MAGGSLLGNPERPLCERVMQSSSATKECCCGQVVTGLGIQLHEAMKVKPDLHWEPRVAKGTRAMGYLHRMLLIETRTTPRKSSVWQSMKLKEVGYLKIILISDMEIRFEISHLFFSLLCSCISSLCSLSYSRTLPWNSDVYPVPYVGTI